MGMSMILYILGLRQKSGTVVFGMNIKKMSI